MVLISTLFVGLIPRSKNLNKALVTSSTKDGKDHVVQNILSKFPSYDCECVNQGNMCKHQLKVLLVRGVHSGVLVQQLGTKFGSEMNGIAHLDERKNPNTLVESHEEPRLLTNNDSSLVQSLPLVCIMLSGL